MQDLAEVGKNCSEYVTKDSMSNSTEDVKVSCSTCDHWVGYCDIDVYDEIYNNLHKESMS